MKNGSVEEIVVTCFDSCGIEPTLESITPGRRLRPQIFETAMRGRKVQHEDESRMEEGGGGEADARVVNTGRRL